MQKEQGWRLPLRGLIVLCLILLVGLVPAGGVQAADEESDDYTVDGTTVTLKVSSGDDIVEQLQRALVYARDNATDLAPITVKIPAGKYKFGVGSNKNSKGRIFSNTILDATGAQITCIAGLGDHAVIMSGINGSYKNQDNYNESKLCAGYNGFKNITIKGGTWVGAKDNTNTIIRLFHATNVTLDGVTVSGGGCAHQVEVAAINGFTVKNCTFRDYGKTGTGNSGNKEAIQLDIPREGIFGAVYLDGTPMKNVTITGCTFKNVVRGVGSHSLLLGAYHENIKIVNNTFDDIEQQAIICLNYRNCEVKNNTITKAGGGILFQNYKSNTDSIYTTVNGKKYNATINNNAKSVISGNKISLYYNKKCQEPQAIKLYGFNQKTSVKGGDGKVIPTGNYYVSGVTITDNTINSVYVGIHFMNARNCTVSNNKITGGSYRGILVSEKSKIGDITGNTLSKTGDYGIFIFKGSASGSIKNNKVNKTGKFGISITESSTVDGEISGNTITSPKANGIMVFKSSTVTKKIANNTITSSGDVAIKLTTKATIKGKISGNTITTPKKKGILIFNSTTTGGIINNTITSPNDVAISVSTKCKVKGEISGNKISKSKNSAIFVNASTVNKDIANNIISKTGDNGIHMTSKAIVKGSIIGNVIKNVKSRGIFVNDSSNRSTVQAIKDNTISGAKDQGIYIASIANALEISGNTIEKSKDHVILINTSNKKVKITVNKNKITGVKKSDRAGIRVFSGKVTIKKNTISKVTRGIWYEKAVKAKVSGNKFKSVKQKVYSDGKEVKQS